MMGDLLGWLLGSLLIILVGCASGTKTVPEVSGDGDGVLVGAVLLENNGVEDVYEAKRSKITAIVIGKSSLDEKVKSYRVKTDKDGFFMIRNVPPGAYVLKGIEADIGYETRLLLTSRWEGNVQIFYPTETMIDYTVRVWPEPSTGRVIDMEICYFGIDAANRVYNDSYPRLQNTVLMLKDKPQTMQNPQQYYQNKFPELEWFQGEQ